MNAEQVLERIEARRLVKCDELPWLLALGREALAWRQYGSELRDETPVPDLALRYTYLRQARDARAESDRLLAALTGQPGEGRA